MIRRPPRSTLDRSSAASDVYKRQLNILEKLQNAEGKIFSEQLAAGYPAPISITPDTIEVMNLETLLRSKTHTYFKNIVINGQLLSLIHISEPTRPY